MRQHFKKQKRKDEEGDSEMKHEPMWPSGWALFEAGTHGGDAEQPSI